MVDLNKTVLVVTPHPDDAEGGAGGTIVKWANEGKKIVLVVCTNGDKGTSDRKLKSAQLAETREKEQLAAAKVMGVSEVVFLREPDQNLEDNTRFREKLVRQIRRHRPEIVMTIDPNRPYIRHRDHYYCGRVTLDAVFPYARDHKAFPEHLAEGLGPHKVQEMYMFRAEEPDFFVDITETFETKMDALYCHASQMGRPREESQPRSRERAAVVGRQSGYELAEGFKHIVIGR